MLVLRPRFASSSSPLACVFHVALTNILVAKNPARAKHVTCSWQDQGPYSPKKAGYERYCLSNVSVINDTNAAYYCFGGTKRVADYGFIGTLYGLLEFAVPCGSQGYANSCQWAQYWGVCDGPADENENPDNFTCYYMGQDDDCEFPDPYDHAPQQVSIWQKGVSNVRKDSD